MASDIANRRLANAGKRRIDWSERAMPVLTRLRERLSKRKPLRGARLSACLHVTAETAVLMRTLKAAGARVVLAASNPLSTQDDVAASLVVHDRVPVFAVKGEGRARYYRHLNAVLDQRPHITMDDGADLVSLMHTKRKELIATIWGSSEETTTGVIRLKSLERQGALRVPVVAVNDSRTKHLFDNRYGTGQSTLDGIIRATNRLIAGSTVVVAGYGWCGRGVATRAKGHGAHVIVTEVDPLRVLEARMDGFDVLPMRSAAPRADIIVTTTGNAGVIREEHFRRLKDGAIIANAGHFDVEIDVARLKKMARKRRELRPNVVEYTLSRSRHIIVLADGRLINLAAAEGHPPAVMDMSFANQAQAALFIAKERGKLEHRVYVLPSELDTAIAAEKLASMGVRYDRLTPQQRQYFSEWRVGT